MQVKRMWLIASALLTLLALFAFAQLSPAGVQAQATIPAPAVPARTVTVVGEGTVTISPDIAQLSVGVEVIQPSVQEASAEARKIMDAVLTALADQGIAEKDIQTSGYSIWAERMGGDPMMGEDGTMPDRYRVNNMVNVTVRNLESVTDVLEATIDAGANNIYGVTFSLDDPTTVEADARAKAVENAKAKADELAMLTGASVGGVVSISEVIGQGGGYFGGNFARSAAYDSMGGGGGPIAAGELSLTMQVQITYELAQ